MTQETYESYIMAEQARRYPNYVTFAWKRSDGDYEIVGTLNGETIDETQLWNSTVRTMLMLLQLNDNDTQAYHREDVVSVLETGEDEDEWKAIEIRAA